MARIVDPEELNPEDSKENPIKVLWENFSSLDKFTKSVILVVLLIVLVTPLVVTISHLFASTVPPVSVEAEALGLSGPVSVQSDSLASGGKYLQFAGVSSVNFQPSAPYYAAFFYPWYQNPNTDGAWSDWQDNSHNPPANWFSNYLPDPDPASINPSSELYSSNNYDIFKWQLSKLAEAKQTVAISSWWGQGHKTDTAFSKIIKDFMQRSDNTYPNLRWALYYEYEGNVNPATGNSNPSVTQLTNDLNYIASNYANQRSYLKINGKPVIFVYGDATDGGSGNTNCSDTADTSMTHRWWLANSNASTKFYVVLKDFPGFASAPCQPDDWHQYSPAVRADSNGNYSFAVSPGFWKNGDIVRLPRDVTAFDAAVKSMAGSTARWRLTETWNEWGEGTSVEPGNQVIQATGTTPATLDPNGTAFGNSFVDILNRDLPPLPQGTGTTQAAPAPITGQNSPTNTPAPTPITSGGDPIIAAAGDIACGTGSSGATCQQQQTVNVVKSINPNKVLLLGDNQYEQGTLSDFQNYYSLTWGQFKSITEPSVGNHEYLTANAQGYFDYFNGIGNQSGPAGDRGKGYYSYNLGNWHLIALNTNCSSAGGCNAGSAQEIWLKADLAANPNKCILAYAHHPMFSSGQEPHNSGVNPLFADLYNARVDIYMSGHDHDYERFSPQNLTGGVDSAKGVTQFVVGTGGRNHTQLTKLAANSLVFNANTFGVLKMILHPTSYDWQFLPSQSTTSYTNGTFTDSGTAQCHS